MSNIDQMQNFFNNNGFLVVKEFINQNTANLLYNYCLMTTKVTDFKMMYDKESYSADYDGHFGDEQVPLSFCKYGDIMMDTLLDSCYSKIGEFVGESLIPTYSYWRLYFSGADLKRHVDRESCDYSFTLHLGHNISNLEDKDYNWEFYLKDKLGTTHEVKLSPGDILIYKGCEVEHWRDSFQGLNHAQVFLHFNNKDTANNVFDSRPMLGLPSKFKNTISFYKEVTNEQ